MSVPATPAAAAAEPLEAPRPSKDTAIRDSPTEAAFEDDDREDSAHNKPTTATPNQTTTPTSTAITAITPAKLPRPPPLPVAPPPRNIVFALEDPLNLLSAIKCSFDHLQLFPLDVFTLVAVVDSDADREMVRVRVTLSRASILLRSIRHQKAHNLALNILVCPPSPSATYNPATMICKLVNESKTKADLLILGLSGDSFLGTMSSYCIMNARCRVIIKRLTYSVDPSAFMENHSSPPPHQMAPASAIYRHRESL
ncbi:hypothetical protein HDU79_000011 [Rhizoclosmatium sp. JEL0117]|nr:hypothetical protein HDU79_000011 [Rhizoclosmatium sp. JEL0117]